MCISTLPDIASDSLKKESRTLLNEGDSYTELQQIDKFNTVFIKGGPR